ncbi:GH21201, partial [Drosophila grimshawi]
PERYVPGSPIFRESSAAPNATPTTTPITAAPSAAGVGAGAGDPTTTTGSSPTSRSRGQAMTVSLSHAAQGNSTTSHHQHSSNNNNNNKPKPLPTCYMSTRSAAMMALALGQHSSEKTSPTQAASCVKQSTSTPSSNASPRTNNRSVSTTRPANRSTPNTTTAPASTANTSNTQKTTATTTSTSTSRSTSKPATPTAVRAAAQLNGMGILSGGSNSSGSDNDGFSTSGSSTATALRRLYFKSGRSIKNKINSSTSVSTPLNSLPMNAVSSAYHNSVSGATPMHPMGAGGVPKLVIMGTSSASIPDTTINTSTDSACTLITNVTHTDTSETCDSLDLGDNSGPSEPLFSSLEEPLLTAIQIDSEHEAGGTELELTSCSRYSTRPDMNLQDSTESQESCLSILTGEPSSTTPLLLSSSRQPSTAPPPTRAREHFTFDPPQSPKSARTSEKVRSHFTFKEDAQQRHQQQQQKQQQQQQQGRRASSSAHYAGTAAGSDDEASQEERIAIVNRNKKLRAKERCDAMNTNGTTTTRNRISPSVSPSSSSRTSPKRERKRTTPSASTGAIAKINSAPPTMKDGNFFGSCQNQNQNQQKQRQTQQQLSPSSTLCAQQQRKYSSSSSSGSSERCLREANNAAGTMFPFDREALDYERIQRECFAPSSATASTSSDSDEVDNCSVYERRMSTDIFQQYSRLTQKEQQQQQQQQQLNHDRDHPPSRKNSKRIRPDSVIHTTIRENQQYVPQSDAFYPQAKSSSSPSDHSYAELNKFEDIANKFEQIPPKHGSNSTLNLHMLHMHSPGSESQQSAALSPTDSTRKRSFKSKSKSKVQQAQQLEDSLPGGGGSINVTANPLEAAAVCKQPRATIVVQQVSVAPVPLPLSFPFPTSPTIYSCKYIYTSLLLCLALFVWLISASSCARSKSLPILSTYMSALLLLPCGSS